MAGLDAVHRIGGESTDERELIPTGAESAREIIHLLEISNQSRPSRLPAESFLG